MQNASLRIMFTGGGSGGPTTPLLAVYNELIKRFGKERLNALFLGTIDGPEKEMVQGVGLPFHSIPSGKLRRYWSWKNLIDPFYVLFGFIIGLIQLIQFRPNVVVSAGSFVSVPVAYAAWVLKIPHIILQMDVRPGLANQIMAPVSQNSAYLFDQTKFRFPPKEQQKIGPVVRSEICEASGNKANDQFNLKPDKPMLLITGGGQGALGLNQAIEPVLEFLLEHFQVVHLTGTTHTAANCSHPDYHHHAFINEGMGNLLARSDLVITRAGLGILGELAYLAKDVIMVPLPGSHQENNCHAIVAAAAGVYLPQQQLLNEGVSWWKNFLNSHQPGTLGSNLRQFLPPGGTEAFVNIILKYTAPE
ncbi:MAG: glycosyltransferase [SAR324 cluster bacterium]|nr:glycosyltransferase [SAR324 cluster bacterium]